MQSIREAQSDGLEKSIKGKSPANTIVFIDPKVDDYQSLVNGVIPEAKVIVLEPTRDGVEQITQVLAGRTGVAAVHIVSHGSPGCLQLGNSQLNLDTLDLYASHLQAWSTPLSPSASILLYGCKVAAGDAGAEFVERLHRLTGADIAASANRTGSAALGGNWELEVVTGEVEAPLVFPVEVREAYSAVLAILIVDSTADVINPNDGVTTLREAIVKANEQVDKDIILFDLGPGPNTINLDPNNGALSIIRDLRIDGPGANDLIVSGQLVPRGDNIDIFSIESPGDSLDERTEVEIQGLTIDQSSRDGIRSDGGGINLILKDSIVRNSDGDAVDLQEQGNNIVRVINSELLDNGEGIDLGGPNNFLTLIDSTVNNNDGDGIIIDGTNSTTTVTDSEIKGNQDEGIDINGSNHSLTLTDSEIKRNGDGLDIDATDSAVTVIGSKFSENVEDGLELDADDIILTVTNSEFNENGQTGLEFDKTRSDVTVTKSTFSENGGEGIFFDDTSSKNTLNIFSSTIENNGQNPTEQEFPSVGGGIRVNGTGNTVKVSDSDILGNVAAGNGGGISNEGSGNDVTVSGSKIEDNTADGNGGGIYNNGILSVINSQIINNTAGITGGGIFNDVNGTISLFSSNVFGNMPNDIV